MQPRTVEFRPAADAELHHARDWYQIRSPRTAERFLAEVDRAIALIVEEPERWAHYLRGTRCFRLRRFPYLVVYRFDEPMVNVIAVAHASRRPGYWRKRLR